MLVHLQISSQTSRLSSVQRPRYSLDLFSRSLITFSHRVFSAWKKIGKIAVLPHGRRSQSSLHGHHSKVVVMNKEFNSVATM